MAQPPAGLRSSLQRRLARRIEDNDGGFTLIELLVVLLIIGILLAIAIPTFLTVTKSANNTAATSNLQTALTAADVYYTQNNTSYTGLNNAGNTTTSPIQSQGTGLVFTSGTGITGANQKTVDLDIGTSGTSIALAALAGGSRCYVVIDNKAGTGSVSSTETAAGTYYGYFTATAGSSPNCDASHGVSGSTVANWSTTGFPS